MKTFIQNTIAFFTLYRNKFTLLTVFHLVSAIFLPLTIHYLATNELLINSLIENNSLAWTLVLVYLGGTAKALSDVLQFKFDISIFKNFKNQDWLNPVLSWDNKYFKNKIVTFIFKHILVFLTDFWHLIQKIAIEAGILAIVFYSPTNGKFIDYLALRTMFALGFNSYYNWWFIQKELRIK